MASIAHFFDPEPKLPGALGQIAEDPVVLAEILVLFRIVLADGVVQPSQLTAFERICEENFGINRRDMRELHVLLDSPKARSCDAKAFTLLAQLDMKARTTLLGNMVEIARASSNADECDSKLIRRMGDLLGLEPGLPVVERAPGSIEEKRAGS